MWWRKRFLDLMEQQTAAIERLCTMQHVLMQHMQQMLMLQGVMPEMLILADTFTHPLYHAFEEVDVASIPACPEGKDAGHVYLLIAENGWCKIGMSRKVTRRMKQHRIQLPFRTKLVHTIPTDNVVWAEDHLHRVFEDCRLVVRKEIRRLVYRGKYLKSADSVIAPLGRDWFRLSTEAVVWIKTIQHMKKPAADTHGRLQWNVPVIPPPELGWDANAYRVAHDGTFNRGDRQRIELLEEHDVDQFWCQFVEPTEPPPKEPSEAPKEGSRPEPVLSLRQLRPRGQDDLHEEDLQWPPPRAREDDS